MLNAPEANKSRKLIGKFATDKKGQVAIILAYAFLPMLGFIGAAIDYSRGAASLAALNTAADATVLNAVAKAKANPSHTLPSNSELQAFFQAALGPNSGITIDPIVITPVNSLTSVTVKISYTASMSTVFMKVLGVNSLNLSGKAQAQAAYPYYIDFQLLLDNSPSMGLAATTADQTSMKTITNSLRNARGYNLVYGTCEFACHQSNGSGGELANDYYVVAKANNIKLRIDELKDGVTSLISAASGNQILANQYRVGLYTFSDSLVTLSGISSDLAAQTTKAGTIDMVFEDGGNHTQTAYDTVLPAMNALVATGGDGLSASTPQKFLFFVTDGVENETMNAYNGTTGSNARNSHFGTVNPAKCQAFKDKNITVGVLYTTYNAVTNTPTNAAYSYYISNVSSFNTSSGGGDTQIQTALKSCASPGYYFETSSNTSISQALQAMFKKATQAPRLTQ